jgi:hypothetical protein
LEKTIHAYRYMKDKRALPWAEVKEELIIAYSFSGDKKITILCKRNLN